MPKWKVDCWSCGGEGFIDGACTCGEDTCCCLEPDPPICPECRGHGVLIVTQLTDDNCDNALPIE